MLIALVLLASGGEAVTELLRYQRNEIASGEWWRMLSAHSVHLSWIHLLLNIFAYGLILVYRANYIRDKSWFVCMLVCALGVSLGLYVFSQQVHWYVGLSGVLHGLMVYVILVRISDGDRTAWAVLPLLAAKLVYEQIGGAISDDAEVLGGDVIIDAHLYGAITGLIWALLVIYKMRSYGKRPGS